jgi:hypothetical protein
MYPWYSRPESTQVWELLHRLPDGKEGISALRRTVREIVEGPFFQRLVPESWEKASVREGKLKSCARICGQDFQPFRDQFMEQTKIPAQEGLKT